MGFKNLTLEYKTVEIDGVKFVLKKWRTSLKAYLEAKVLDGREFDPETGRFFFNGVTSEEDACEDMILKIKSGLQKWHILDENDELVPVNDETVKELLDDYPVVASRLMDEIEAFNASVISGKGGKVKKKGK